MKRTKVITTGLLVHDLHVEVHGREILHGVNLEIHPGETHVLLGPNGCGKSTLLSAIMGFGDFTVTKGNIFYNGRDITKQSIDARARLGIGVMYQKAPSISGLKLRRLLSAIAPSESEERMEEMASSTNVGKLLMRDVNHGFSGGEVKRSELMQLLCQHPTLVMCDEPESGVDLENISLVGKTIEKLVKRTPETCGLIITHSGNVLDYMKGVDNGHIMIDGHLQCQGNPRSLLSTIRRFGFDGCVMCARDPSHPKSCATMDIEETPVVLLPPTFEDDFRELVEITARTQSEADKETKSTKNGKMGEPAPRTKKVAPSCSTGPANINEGGRVVISDIMDDDPLDVTETLNYLQVDDRIVQTLSPIVSGIEVLSLENALEKYSWIKERIFWNVVPMGKDEVTRYVALHEETDKRGYVIIAHEGVDSGDVPVRVALQLEDMEIQHVHNIIVAKKGSRLHVVSSCSCSQSSAGAHYGVTEFWVEEDAHLSNTMIHKWCDKSIVYPRSATIVEKNGVFLSNYVSTNAVKTIQSYPVAYLNGEGAVARFNSVIVAPKGALIDTGSRAILGALHTRAEMVSRMLTFGGKIIARAHIIGAKKDTYGHIECQGLVLHDTGGIHAIPEVEGIVEGSELSHEAAVGKIAREKIEYVMSRGLTEEQAIGTVIRGFVDVDMKGIPASLQKEIHEVVEVAAMGF
uniref:SufCB n=1 Tax=Stygiella incarcerata TaxID=1712417 RepID=A0A192ZIY2_9EUKA|nr:SufCB [Stygiella incarcerata]ANM86888.1 SufCB [Stygiella incarcerata]|eukprot:TRINITY_DN2856_c0_g1_i1.p1 TRINITY_DN2856_c0_g1~~TRINITY_DN2856_c0_g1_i1.p1  ORF type:complete len:715 (-),score=189.74 TRINITY_DN2856_c0_g1_i1:124-2193(-)